MNWVLIPPNISRQSIKYRSSIFGKIKKEWEAGSWPEGLQFDCTVCLRKSGLGKQMRNTLLPHAEVSLNREQPPSCSTGAAQWPNRGKAWLGEAGSSLVWTCESIHMCSRLYLWKSKHVQQTSPGEIKVKEEMPRKPYTKQCMLMLPGLLGGDKRALQTLFIGNCVQHKSCSKKMEAITHLSLCFLSQPLIAWGGKARKQQVR